MSPRNIILSVLLVALFCAERFFRPVEATLPARLPVFTELHLTEVSRVEVFGGKEEDSDSIALERTAKGWIVRSHFDFPAHDWAVEDLLSRLRNLDTLERVSQDPQGFALFGFDGSERRVEITASNGRSLAQLQVASVPEGRGTYVKPLKEDAIYRAAALPLVEVDPIRYVRADLLDFDPASLQRIELAHSDWEEELVLKRESDGRWRGKGGELLSPSKVDSLIAFASHLYLQKVVAASPRDEHGLDGQGWARLGMIADDGESASIVVGLPVPKDQGGLGERYATDAAWQTPWVVTVDSLVGERLSRLARSFLAR